MSPKKFHTTCGKCLGMINSITNELLQHRTANMQYNVEPGEYEIMIGPNSNDVQKRTLIVK